MDNQHKLKNWVEHVTNGCCHVYMRQEKHDLDFTRFVVIETLSQLAAEYDELPEGFGRQIEELKSGFLVDLQNPHDEVINLNKPSPSSTAQSADDVDKRPGQILQLLATDREMTAQDIAAALKCPSVQVGSILSGKQLMTPKQIVAAADRFCVAPSSFYRPVTRSAEDFVVRASQEHQLMENTDSLTEEEFDCLVDCSRAFAKLHRISST